MKSNPLAAIERTNLVLAAAVTCVGGVVWGLAGMKGAAAGAALAVANLWVIRRLAVRAFARVEGGTPPALAGLGTGLMLKMLALFALLWVAVNVVGFAPVPFALGLSVLPVSLVGSGLFTALKLKKEAL